MASNEIQIIETPIVGDARALANALTTARRNGALVSHGASVTLPDGRHVVMARMVVASPAPPPRAPTARRWLVVTGASAALGVVGALVWLVVVAVAWVSAHLALTLVCLALFALAMCGGLSYIVGGGSGGSRISGTFSGRIHRRSTSRRVGP